MSKRLRVNQSTRCDNDASSNDLESGSGRRFAPGLLRDRIVAALPDGTDVALVIRQIESATRTFWDEALAEFHWEGADLVERKGKTWLRITKRPFPAKGRPRKDALRRYVAAVIAIYEYATGKKMKRVYDAYRGKDKRPAFLVACLRAAGVPSYPTRLIREVIEKK